MEILHLKDLGDTASVVTNAVVLVLGEGQFQYQLSIPLGGIYLHIRFYCNVLGTDKVMPL